MPVESGALIERVEQQAQEAESQGDLDQAVRSLRALESAAPQDPEINLRLGRILTWKGEYFEAEVMLRRAVEEDPQNVAAWEALGLLYLQTGRFHEADMLFKEHVPGGMPHASLLKEVEAESIRQQVRRGDPYALSRLLYEQAGQAYEAGDTERALPLYLAVHTFHPQLPLVSYRIGRIYASQGEPLKAIPFLQQAFLFQPDNYDALELLSASQLRVGQVEEAYQGFLKVLERYPGSVTATIGLIEAEQKLFGPDAELVIKERGLLYQAMAEALLLEKEKKYLEAAKIWLELTEIYPKYSIFFARLGEAYLDGGEMGLAESALKQALVIAPEDDDALLILSYLYLRENRLEEALEGFNAVLSRSPGYEAALEGVALAQRRLYLKKIEEDASVQCWIAVAKRLDEKGCYDYSYRYWLSAHQSYPDHVPFIYRLGRNYLARGDLMRAQLTLEAALDLAPQDGDVMVQLGYVYLLADRYCQALRYFDKVLALHEDHGDAALGRARTLRDAHCPCPSVRAYAKALKIYPGDAVIERETHETRRYCEPSLFAFSAYGKEVETDLFTNVKSAERHTNVNRFEFVQPISRWTRLTAFGGMGFEREIALVSATDNFRVSEKYWGGGFEQYFNPDINVRGRIAVKQGLDEYVSNFPFQNTTRVEPEMVFSFSRLRHRLFLSSVVDSFIVKNFVDFTSFYLPRWKNEITYQYQWLPTATYLGTTAYLRKYDDGNEERNALLYFQFPIPKYSEWAWVRQEWRTGGFNNTRVDYYSYRELLEYTIQGAVFKNITPTTLLELSFLHAWRKTRDLSQPVTSPVFVPLQYLNINKFLFTLKQNWRTDLEFWLRGDCYWDSSNYTAYSIRGYLYWIF